MKSVSVECLGEIKVYLLEDIAIFTLKNIIRNGKNHWEKVKLLKKLCTKNLCKIKEIYMEFWYAIQNEETWFENKEINKEMSSNSHGKLWKLMQNKKYMCKIKNIWATLKSSHNL